MATQRKVDVVTVGAGWTASILAWKLGEAGLDVVSLEQGPTRWAYPDFAHNHDSLRYSVRKAMMLNLSKETWTWRPNSGAPALPMRRYGSFHPGTGLGGSATHWSAMLYRFTPTDFKIRSHYTEKYGPDIIPPDMTIQDWPITYEELEPYYSRFELDIGASGQTGNLNGELIDGGNPYEGPRSIPYPNPPLVRSIPSHIFADACDQLGYHPFPQPSGILSQAYTDRFGITRSGCLYCGFCTRFGCEVDAKSSAVTTHIPLALRTGHYEIRPNARVLSVNLNNDGLATGLTYVDEFGEEHFQPANIVILSGYTLANVKLLLVSRDRSHPNGIGNDRGMVGKNYTYQIWQTPVTGVFEGRRFNLYMGNTTTMSVIYDFYGDNFDHSGLDFIDGAGLYSTIGEREPVTSVGSLPFGDGQKWGQEWKDSLRRNWDAFVPIAIQGGSMAHVDNFMDLDPNYRDAWGQPLLRLTFDFKDNDRNLYRFVAEKAREIMEAMGPTTIDFTPELGDYNIHEYQSTHVTGGAIMGSSPGDSVTNKYGQVWDTPNVFVTGAALYPQNPGANPSDTLCALAYMTGDAIRDIYLRNPNQIMT